MAMYANELTQYLCNLNHTTLLDLLCAFCEAFLLHQELSSPSLPKHLSTLYNLTVLPGPKWVRQKSVRDWRLLLNCPKVNSTLSKALLYLQMIHINAKGTTLQALHFLLLLLQSQQHFFHRVGITQVTDLHVTVGIRLVFYRIFSFRKYLS